jgi:hypothetical protein
LKEQFLDFPQLATGRPVTETAKTAWFTNGDRTEANDVVNVTCFVIGDSSGAWARGFIGRAPPQGTFTRQVDIEGNMFVGKTSQAALIMSDSELGNGYDHVFQRCMFSLLEVDQVARSFWGTFTCTSLSGPDSGGTCSLGPSFFAFENCSMDQNG